MSVIASVKGLGDVVGEYDSANFRGSGSFWYNGANGDEFHFQLTGADSSLKAYNRCAPLHSVVNRCASAYVNGKTWVLNSRGKEATTEEAKKLRRLLARPNPLQSWKQFEAQAYIYKKLYGYYLILPIIPVGYIGNINAAKLWIIPPHMLDIEETNKLFYTTDLGGIIKKITLTYNGVKTALDLKDVYIMKDFSPSISSLVIPDSPLKALEMPINNIIGAYESRNILINYRGALGILTNDTGSGQFGGLPLSETEKANVQDEFKRYGLKNSQWKFIITSASLKWQQVGIPTKDLLLFEEIEDDVMRICDEYRYPYRLLSSNKNNSLGGADVREYMKLLYTDGIIPEAESDYEQWNQFFDTAAYNLKLDKDYSHLSVMQADRVQEATARKILNEALSVEYERGLITLNQWLERLGEDTIPSGDLRITELEKSAAPLAVTIGVGGVQSLIAIVTAQGLSEEAKRNVLVILFGISQADAASMVAGSDAAAQTSAQAQQQDSNNANNQNNGQ